MIDRTTSTTVTTTCGYCGVGCRLEAHAREGRVVSISPRTMARPMRAIRA